MLASGRRLVRTMCPMSCHPTLCGMLVEVEDGRLVQVSGDHANPDSQGFLCVRGQASREIIGNPKRLLRPLIRTRRSEEAWREATWDEALDLIVGRSVERRWGSGPGMAMPPPTTVHALAVSSCGASPICTAVSSGIRR